MKIKGVLVDVKNEKVEVVEIEKTLEEYYRILNCDCIDIISRKIGEKWFDIVCDDEGLLKENPKISAIDNTNQPQLCGNLFIVKFDGVEDITSISDEEAEYIMERIMLVSTNFYPKGYPILTQLGW